VLFRYFDIPIARQDRPTLRRYYDALVTRPAFCEHVMVSYEELKGLELKSSLGWNLPGAQLLPTSALPFVRPKTAGLISA
jgi:hypothetical protein